ncbi:MAG: hypothetical protein ABIQ95_11660 [Bdellovibrionia bacterium]
MQQRSFASHVANSMSKPSPVVAKAGPPQTKIAVPSKESRDELARVFNTAIVSSQANTTRDLSAELQQLTQSAPFKAILNAVRQLAAVQGITERQSAEVIIETFREMDEVWSEYVFREGLDKIRKPRR